MSLMGAPREKKQQQNPLSLSRGKEQGRGNFYLAA
jgi:hypothetical protein